MISERRYKEEVALAVKEGALLQLNCPSAIQRLPTLDERKAQIKVEVASKSGALFTLTKYRVGAQAKSFKADKVCKHSVAVAEKNEMLRKHLEQICKGQGEKNASRTALAETFMNKSVAGKKGSRKKSYYCPSSANDSTATAMQSEESSNNATYVYNEIYHNDHSFVLCLLPSDAKTCKGWKNDFCHRQKIMPFDLMSSHKERYYSTLHRDWKNKQASNKELLPR